MDISMPASRRDAIKIGGVSLTLGAFLAACGEGVGGSEEPGRVGNAPPVETLPDLPVDDIVYLRTASSLEYTAVAVYETLLGMDGLVDDDLVPFVERIMENHTMIAEQMVELTTAAGGEPWECPNDWFMERFVAPIVAAIQAPIVGVIQSAELLGRVRVAGEELDVDPNNTVTTSRGALAIESDVVVEDGIIVSIDGSPAEEDDEVLFTRPADDMRADIAAVINALESFATASHQELTSKVATDNLDARVAHIEAATLEARHAAAVAIQVDGADGYISPALLGEDVAPAEDGQIRQFAINSTFGLTSQIEIKAGGADLNGVRESFILQTPADNSYVYNELEPSCSA